MTGAGPGPRVVLIIGGSSGIGLAAGLAFSARGDHVVLAARGRSALVAAAARCRARGAAGVETVVTDVADAASVQALFDQILAQHPRLDVTVHTATVMAYGDIEQLPAEVFEKVVDTAIHGTAHIARSVFPVLRGQGGGTLIVVNSLLGSIATPHMGAYVTAKWGQLGLIRVLQLEARKIPGAYVCVVSPGSTNTPIYYQAANYTGRAARPPWPIDQPEKVARAIVGLADRPRRRVSVGPANPFTVFGFRFMPFLYDRLVTPLVEVAALSRRAMEPDPGNVLGPNESDEGEYGHWPRGGRSARRRGWRR